MRVTSRSAPAVWYAHCVRRRGSLSARLSHLYFHVSATAAFRRPERGGCLSAMADPASSTSGGGGAAGGGGLGGVGGAAGAAPATKKRVRCGICQGDGHNRRTCPRTEISSGSTINSGSSSSASARAASSVAPAAQPARSKTGARKKTAQRRKDRDASVAGSLKAIKADQIAYVLAYCAEYERLNVVAGGPPRSESEKASRHQQVVDWHWKSDQPG